jgi:aminoglycoside phosphotransferase (APT) family kinase protein
LSTYDDGTRQALATLGDRVDGAAATAVWNEGLASTWTRDPVWFHGDVAGGNLLVRDGRLSAVIDFGTSGVGDPACDLAIAWTLLTPASRTTFRAGLDLDDDTWARGRAWTLWKALITLESLLDDDPATSADPRRVLDEVLEDARPR